MEATVHNAFLAVAIPEEVELLIALIIFVAPLLGVAWVTRELRRLRQRARSRPAEMSGVRPSRVRLVVYCCLILVLGMVPVAEVISFRHAQARGSRDAAYGRLSQMRTALQIYENLHGTLPPLYLRDSLGKPIHSWRALILPQLGLADLSRQLDLSQSWNSDHNRGVMKGVPLKDWAWFTRDQTQTKCPVSTQVLAYVGRNSIWDATTGLPKGKTAVLPDAILLVSIPKSNLEPLQPGDVTEDEVRTLIGKGHEVLFITARSGNGTGIVTVERNELVFRTWQQCLDQRNEVK